MRKYLAIAKIKLLDAFEYRSEVILWQIIELIPILTITMVWLTIGKTQIQNYSTSQLITYYLTAIIIGRLVEYHFADWQADNIRTGRFSINLVKPLSIAPSLFANSLSGKIMLFFITTIPLFSIILFFFRQYLILPHINQIVPFIIMLVLGNLISFFLEMIIVACAFFLKNVNGIRHFKWMSTAVLGGYIIPLTLLPNWLQTITNFLPFKYLYFAPISIFLGQMNNQQIITSYLTAIIWIIILWSIQKLLWRRGIRAYSAVGV
jgi:ABC-2 type transport system permease protein